MRPQVKQLIDLVESEAWPQHVGRLSDDDPLGDIYYSSSQFSYPRVTVQGAQLDEKIYLPFEDDERRKMYDMSCRRHAARQLSERKKAESKLAAFLFARRS